MVDVSVLYLLFVVLFFVVLVGGDLFIYYYYYYIFFTKIIQVLQTLELLGRHLIYLNLLVDANSTISAIDEYFPLTYIFKSTGRERNVLFNDALNTFYLRLYGVRHMVKDHSDSEKGNPLSPHRLFLSINSKGSFICTIPQKG